MELQSNNKIFNKKCELLQLLACPYIGIYNSQYEFMMPIEVLRKEYDSNSSLLNNFPTFIQNEVAKSLKNSVNLDVEEMLINLDSTDIHNKLIKNGDKNYMKRINMVVHPYIFDNLKYLDRDHDTKVLNAIFTNDNAYNPFILKESTEEDGISINPDKLFTEKNHRKVILHEVHNSPAISPNNNAFLFNTKAPFISFKYLCGVFYKGSIVRLLISQFNVFNKSFNYFPYNNIIDCLHNTDIIHYNLAMIKHKFVMLSREIIKTLYKSDSKSSSSILDKYISFLFKDNKNNLNNYFEQYLISIVLSKTEIDEKIDENIIKGLIFDTDSYSFFLFLNMMSKYLIKDIDDIVKGFELFYKNDRILGLDEISEINKEITTLLNINLYKESTPYSEDKANFKLEVNYLSNNIIYTNVMFLEEILNTILTDSSTLFEKLTLLTPQISDLLFFLTWKYKGSLEGIHSEFGKHSFLNSYVIPSCYFCSNEDAIDIVEYTCRVLNKLLDN